MSELIFLTKSISASSDNLEISTVRITSAGEFFPSDLSLWARPFLACKTLNFTENSFSYSLVNGSKRAGLR